MFVANFNIHYFRSGCGTASGYGVLPPSVESYMYQLGVNTEIDSLKPGRSRSMRNQWLTWVGTCPTQKEKRQSTCSTHVNVQYITENPCTTAVVRSAMEPYFILQPSLSLLEDVVFNCIVHACLVCNVTDTVYGLEKCEPFFVVFTYTLQHTYCLGYCRAPAVWVDLLFDADWQTIIQVLNTKIISK